MFRAQNAAQQVGGFARQDERRLGFGFDGGVGEAHQFVGIGGYKCYSVGCEAVEYTCHRGTRLFGGSGERCLVDALEKDGCRHNVGHTFGTQLFQLGIVAARFADEFILS